MKVWKGQQTLKLVSDDKRYMNKHSLLAQKPLSDL